jgi:Tweety
VTGIILIVVPWIAMALIYLIALCIIYFCPCCAFCVPKKRDGDEESKGRRGCQLMLIIFTFLALAGIGFAIYATVLLFQGLDDTDSALEQIIDNYDEMIGLADDAEQLAEAAIGNTESYEAACGGETPLTGAIKGGLNQFLSALDEFDELADGVEKVFDDAKSTLDIAGQAVTIAGYVIFGIGVFIMIMAFIGIFVSGSGSCKGFSLGLRIVMMPIAIIVIFLLWLFVGVMAANVMTADYCMDPDDNTPLLTDDDDVSDVIAFYTTCEGKNPLDQALTRARILLLGVEALVEALSIVQQSTCPAGAGDVAELSANIDSTVDVLDELRDLLECSFINEPYQTFAYDALCDDWANALLFMWIGALVSAFFFSFMIMFYDAANGRQVNPCCGGAADDD